MINVNRVSTPPHRTWVTPMPEPSKNPIFILGDRIAHGPVRLSDILKCVQQIQTTGEEPHKA